jgi:hypothetical protein
MAHLWPWCGGKVVMTMQDGTTSRTVAGKDEALYRLMEQQAEMFERIATRLESMDSRLERLISLFEGARSISSQHF